MNSILWKYQILSSVKTMFILLICGILRKMLEKHHVSYKTALFIFG